MFQRRLSKGLKLNANFTHSAAAFYNTIVNEYDTAPPQWTPTNNPLPNCFNTSGIYELPFGRGRVFLRNGLFSHLIGNWQVAMTYDFQQGPFRSWGTTSTTATYPPSTKRSSRA